METKKITQENESNIMKSGDFRGRNRCSMARLYDSEIGIKSLKNEYYDNALIVKEIIKGWFEGKYQNSDFADLVSQGIENEYLTEKNGELRCEQLTKILMRYCNCEFRKPLFPEKQVIEINGYQISIKPDAVFESNNELELVIYRAGRPNVKQKGKKRDHCVDQCLELYFLLQCGKTMLKPNTVKKIKASYYFMRKDTDRRGIPWDDDFFSGTGGNIVYLEQTVRYEDRNSYDSELDINFLAQLDEFAKGTDECTEEECRSCQWNSGCHYIKTPERFDKKTNSSKNGKIVPSYAQQKIIDFRKGICRVNATAGSGKTECMTERGACMIEEGIKPEEILFITFTDAGAGEMKTRISQKCKARGLTVSDCDINAMTFNAFAYNIVQDNYEALGYEKMPQVIDDVRNSVIITQILDEHPVAGLDELNFQINMPNCRGALACSQKTFNIMKTLDATDGSEYTRQMIENELNDTGYRKFIPDTALSELINLYDRYDHRLKKDCLIQFSDQEPLMNKVLDMYPDYLEKFGYKHIIVDEFQDSNDVQMNTILALTQCSSFESLMVVGDDSQSIYGFRNTSPENIISFFEKLGYNQGTDLYLTENRRSTPEIIDFADSINRLNKNRIEKEMTAVRESGDNPVIKGFVSKDDEYTFIVDNMKHYINELGYAPEDIAFIAAKKSELVTMAEYLTKEGIPWVMMNPIPLMENSRVKAALSLAEAFVQPTAESLYFDYLAAKYNGEIFVLRTSDEIKAEITELKIKFMNMDLLRIPYQRQLFHEMLEALGKDDEIYNYFLDLLTRCEDFQTELEYIMNFRKFGESVSKKMEQQYQGVVLTTAHSSKGLEWKIVFNSITNFDAKYLHTGRNKEEIIEEKRRLLFVSATRARDILYITGQYIIYGDKDKYVFNQFLIDSYNVSGQKFVPVFPDNTTKKSEKIELQKKLLRGNRGIRSREMSPSEKQAYDQLVVTAKQESLL